MFSLNVFPVSLPLSSFLPYPLLLQFSGTWNAWNHPIWKAEVVPFFGTSVYCSETLCTAFNRFSTNPQSHWMFSFTQSATRLPVSPHPKYCLARHCPSHEHTKLGTRLQENKGLHTGGGCLGGGGSFDRLGP